MKLIFSLKRTSFLTICVLFTFLLFLVSSSTPSFKPYQWKLIKVQDSEDSLPYETNGEGPNYHEDDVRFQELQSHEPPHPDMPDEMPQVLLEMQEKLSQMLGLPNNNRKTEPSNYSIDDVQRQLMKPGIIEQDFRFAQINADTKLSQKDKNALMSMDGDGSAVPNAYDTVTFSSAWASSVYTFRFWWYYHSYPASNAINGWSYWCSTGGHAPDQIVTWQGDLERIRRISHIWINWAYAPGYLSVQTTSDGKTWEERIPWREAAKSRASQASRIFFWWWQYNARSYAESVVFEEPIWMTGVRILMKDPVFYYFGIYQVKAWTKQWLVQLKSGQNMESDDCLNINDGILQRGAEITVRNCIEAIQQDDGRELFVLQNNLEITSYNQDLCMETSNGVLTEDNRMQLWTCKDIKSCCNDGREKWVLDPKGYMKSLKNTDKCITIKGSEIELQQKGGVVAEASSTMNDGQHEPKLAIDGSDDSYWASQPGVEKAELKVHFPAGTVKELEIIWKYIPEHFEVLCYINGYWRSFLSQKENSEQTTKITIGSKTISGFRILLIKASDSARFNDKVVYGINSVKIKTGARAVHLKDCNSETNSQLNKWFVDDANFVDISPPPKLAAEFKRLFDNTNRLLDLVNTVISWPPRIAQMVNKAKLIASQTMKIESDINGLDLKLEQFKAQNLQEEEEDAKKDSGLGAVGASSAKPATSCAFIKNVYPYKMSGYYWLQPECTKVPIRVFCDYTTSSNGIDYAYYGGLGDSIIKHKIKSVNDVRYYCAKLGLFPVELKSKDQITLIHRYLADIGVNMQSKGFVPLGIDYPCLSKNQCSGKFHSLNGKTSVDITDTMKGMLDTQNILMQGFAKLFNEKKDYLIGFGLSKSGAMTSKFDSNVPIKGIICSSNNQFDSEGDWLRVECDTKARGNSDFDGVTNTIINVICPSDCVSNGKGKVVGTEVFTDDSSVCKAAIHNGVLSSDKGGKMRVSITEGKSSYLGSDSFGIKSEGLDIKWDRSIVTDRYVQFCPIDNFKNREASFLDIADQTYFPGVGNLINSAKQTANNAVNTAKSAANTAVNTGKNLINNAVSKGTNIANNAINTATSAAGDAANAVGDAASAAGDAISNAANLLGGGAGNSDGSNSDGQGTQQVKSGGGQIDSTEEAIDKLIGLFDLDKNEIIKPVRLVKDTSDLLDGIKKEYGPLTNSNLSPEYQTQYLDTLALHLKGTQIEMNKALVKAALKVKKKEAYRLKLRLEKMKYLKYDPYTENYDLRIEEMYDIKDFAQASSGPSKWTFSKDSLNGHATAIAQTSDIQINGDPKERYASVLKLKMKSFFDGRISVSMLAKDTGRIGIAFRYLDEFNFYVFEMERGNGGSGYKRIRKFVNGEPTVLAVVNDGGYLQDKWYRIIVDFSLSMFTVRMEDESEKNLNPDFEDQMTKVIEGYDGDFAEGGFAFMVNSMAGVYFDKFTVRTNKCIDQSKQQDPNTYVPQSCSRFKESFFTDLNFLWKGVDPENNKNGPSSWQYIKYFKGKSHVIEQKSLIYGADSGKTPALLQLKIDKVCNHGLIQTEFNSDDKGGFVGVAFHYENSKNHYTFEVSGGEKERFCQVRKATDGSYSLLQKSEDNKCGYEPGKWTSVTIRITNTEWVFFMAKENEGLVEVMKMPADTELPQGSIALLTFNCKAAFSAIKMMPLEDFTFKGGELSAVEVDLNPTTPPNTDEANVKKPEDNTKNGNEAEKEAEYDNCLQTKSPEDRDKYCSSKFGEDKSAVSDCKKNFCDRCCEDNIDSVHKIKRFKCKKTCKGFTQNDKESDEWKLCVESPRPTLSIYQYCETTQMDKTEKNRCKIDFCNLCCTVADGVFKKRFADQSIESCHKECVDNFAEIKDVVV